MRLLSFLSLVEDSLGTSRPAESAGWKRQVNYLAGTAVFWHTALGLTLTLRNCPVSNGRQYLECRWHGASGDSVETRSFFSGAPGFDWNAAADDVVDAMPEPALAAPKILSEPAPDALRVSETALA